MAEPPSVQGRESQDRRSAPGSSARQTGVGGAGDGNERQFGRAGGRPRRDGGSSRGGPGKGDKEKTAAEVWIPTTKLGRLVKAGKVRSMETIFSFSLPVKEYQIIDQFLPAGTLNDEVLKIMPVQKQTPSGQRTRFKAFVVVGDKKGHVGLGVKCSKEVATAIRGGIIAAKLSIVPVRLGYWGNKIGAPHTVPTKVTGKCGSVRVRLVPAPRGTGIVAAGTPHKLLSFAGVDDVYTKCQGHTKTLGNFAIATFNAIQKTFEYQTPDLWKQEAFKADPYHEFSQELEDLAVEYKKDEAKRAGRLDDKDGNSERGSDRRGGNRFGADRDFRQGGRGFGGRRDDRDNRDSQSNAGANAEGGNQNAEGQQGAEGTNQQGGEQSGFGQDRPRRDNNQDGGSGFGSDRPRRDFGDRPRREGGYRERRDNNQEGGDRSSGFGGDRPRRDYGDRPRGEGYQRRDNNTQEGGDRSSGFGGDRPRRDYGDRPRYGDRDNRGGGGGFRGGDNQGQGGFRGRRDDRPDRNNQGGGFGGGADRGTSGFGNADRNVRGTSDQGSQSGSTEQN